MRRPWIPLMLLLLLAAPGWAGTLEGTLELKSALKKRPQGQKSRFPRAPGTDYTEPRAVTRDTDETRNVVLYLVGPTAKSEPTTARVVQKNREFVPFVTVVTAGSAVEFPNQDTIYHSVYSESSGAPFHLPEYPQGESRTVTFPKPGVIELFCAIHPHMNAYVLVLANRFFAQPDEQHHFRIEQVPAGRYVLKAWHPLLEPVTRVIEVPATGSIQVSLTL